jgi:hypothetical protein
MLSSALRLHLNCCVLLLSWLAVGNFASAQFDGMRWALPTDSNMVILIDAEKLFGSRLADNERWQAKRKAAYDAGVSVLAPDVSQVILGGLVDVELGQSVWEVALARFSEGRDISSIARRFGGSIDRIGDRTAAKLPNDIFVVQVTDKMIGTHIPANRQSVFRWIKSIQQSDFNGDLSPYLKTAFEYSTKVGTPIVMAIDLSGVISKEIAAQRLSTAATIKQAGATSESVNELAELVSSVKGITLGIVVGEKATGAVRVDFGGSPDAFAKLLKPLLIETLEMKGAMIDDLESWEPSIDGNTFLLRGTMSPAGLRRVMSVLEMPASLTEAFEESSSSAAGGSGEATASKIYFQQISVILDDLRAKPKRDGVSSHGQVAIWFDKYARKIDQLPILGVDADLLSYGAETANKLRDCSLSLKGVGMRSGVRSAENRGNVPVVVNGYGGWRSGYTTTTGYASDQQMMDATIRRQESYVGVNFVQQSMQAVDEATSVIRRAMTMKYQVEF